MRRIASFVAAAGLALGIGLTGVPFVTEAHESRTIADGTYQIVAGFMNEPVFAGEKSGLEFWVTEVPGATPAAGEEAEGAPVEGLEETLQAEVIYQDQTLALPLSPMFGEPGGYYSVFFPTASQGDYTFRIYGTINGTEIDESFTSGPATFGPVQDPAPLRFPQK